MDTKPKLTAAASTVQLIDLTSHRLVIKSRQQQKNKNKKHNHNSKCKKTFIS